VLGWGHIQPDDVAHLGDELRIGGQLERLLPMRLQPESAPDPLHRADREATVARHAARTPVRGIIRLALQRAGDHRFDAFIVDRARRTGARFVAQPLDPLLEKAAPPLADRHGMHAKLMADRLVLQPIRTGQDDPGALSQRLSRLRPGRQPRQFRPLGFCQPQRFQSSPRHACLPAFSRRERLKSRRIVRSADCESLV
jgi:hypothetical protein